MLLKVITITVTEVPILTEVFEVQTEALTEEITIKGTEEAEVPDQCVKFMVEQDILPSKAITVLILP